MRSLLLSERPAEFLRDLVLAANDLVERAVGLEDACARYPEPGALAVRAGEHRPLLDAARRRAGAAFGLPADPRDLLAAVDALDGAASAIDHARMTLGAARPASLPEIARAQSSILVRATMRIADAADHLYRRRDPGADVADVRQLERTADRLSRAGLAALFASGLAANEILRLKAIHESLEDAVDACRVAADTLGALGFSLRR